jgi:hypothetical protein
MDDLPFPDYGAYREIPEILAEEWYLKMVAVK